LDLYFTRRVEFTNCFCRCEVLKMQTITLYTYAELREAALLSNFGCSGEAGVWKNY